jgi:hypothetical protein
MIKEICGPLVHCETYVKTMTCEHNKMGLYEVDDEDCPCYYFGSCPENFQHKEKI